MGIIDDKRLKRTVEQTNPTNPTGNTSQTTNRFDIEKRTIKEQQNKK
ncbi:hypothetical protein I2486_11785 [Cellulophaga sp. E16_2]|uniref:Uncharacterized protein n=1 Tax=Cellulophaga algicola (strain DSM 14237 / IC166 / ACAM 630) TaxID=688270 RepID=E6X7F5_CELAD|nr:MULTISPECIES: hypothetical protein [Cellulophaga]ADV49637.1 hypothetical protein Celal_2346 [Cellulophaga algicola DSM 14237]MBO0592088.1 hypothetical protein [Cellulophaga sp. E16_2]